MNAKLQKSVFDRPEVLLRLQLHFTAAAVMMGEFTDPFHYFSTIGSENWNIPGAEIALQTDAPQHVPQPPNRQRINRAVIR